MTAPTRIVYGARNTYRLDPYVRDTAGRFAPKPAQPPAPVQLLEESGRVEVIDISNGNGAAFTSGPDPSCYFSVRVIRDDDGTHRTEIRPPQA